MKLAMRLQPFFDADGGAAGGQAGDGGAGGAGTGEGGNNGGGNAGGNDPGSTFTQADVDRIVKERLARASDKFKDYDQLKAAADELAKIKEGQMSEQEKLQAQLKQLEEEREQAKKDAAAVRLEMSKSKVMSQLGIPAEFANRIAGTTPEEIEADAKAFKELLGASGGGTPIGGGGNPAGGANNGKKDFRTASKDELNAELRKMGIRSY